MSRVESFPMPAIDVCYFCDIAAGTLNQWQVIAADGRKLAAAESLLQCLS